MFRDIDVEKAIKLDAVFIDVRSEMEYQEAHIPQAVNIPLFNNEERAQIGTIYKQVSPEAARMLGLEIASAKLPEFVKQVKTVASDRPAIVYCWRGGMRSRAVASILQLMGIDVVRVIGGYKAYRRFINDFFQQSQFDYRAVVISGLTGVGKTDLLDELSELGVPVLDLEGLANNRGSVFGAIGLGAQPSQKDFEASLFNQILTFGDAKCFAVECESKRIGRLIVPDIIWQAMQAGPRVLVYAPVAERIQRLVKIYATGEEGSLAGCKQAISALTKRLGKETTEALNQAVDRGDLAEVVEKLLVDYYDPLYKYPDHPDPAYELSVDSTDVHQAALKIKDFMDTKVG